MIRKYLNQYTYIGAFIVLWLMLAISIGFIRPMSYKQLVGDYKIFYLPICHALETLQIDADSRLISFRDSNGRDIGVEAIYEFADINDESIEEKYKEKIAALNWKRLAEEEGATHYQKDGLELFVSHTAPRVWKIYITAQGFQDKGVLERLLFGNKRT